MAAVPIQIDGILWDVAQKKGTKVSLIGSAHIVGLGVGGGPIIPEVPGGPPGEGGLPEHPIVPPGGYPHPEHPIVLPPGNGGIPPIPPDPPELPPGTPPNTVVKAPPEGGWGYITDANGALQAVYNPGEGAAGPKSGGQSGQR